MASLEHGPQEAAQATDDDEEDDGLELLDTGDGEDEDPNGDEPEE